MRKKQVVLAGLTLFLMALVVRPPSADIRVLAHEAGDRAPHKLEAALDLGVVALSLLVTWTAQRATA